MDEPKKLRRTIIGSMKGIEISAVSPDDEHESVFLYPSQHTPEELVDELRQLINFIEERHGWSFYCDSCA